MQITNLIHVRFTAQDLAALVRGEMRSMTTSDGLTIQFNAEPGLTKRAVKAAAQATANGEAPRLPEAPRTLGELQGDCTLCEAKNIKLLAAHYRQKHRGKPIPIPGGGLECPTCHRQFPSERSLELHRRNVHVHKKAAS